MPIRRPFFVIALLAFVLGLAPLAAPAHADDAKEDAPKRIPILWEVQTKPTIYLFGTIHVADERVTTHPEVVKRALANSKALYTELGPYEQDIAGPLPVLPSLDAARKLPSMDPESDEYGFLKAHLVRERNKIVHSLDMALERANALRLLF